MSYSFEDFLNTVRIETGPVMTTNNLYWAEAFLNRKKIAGQTGASTNIAYP